MSHAVRMFFTVEYEEDVEHTDYLLPDGMPSFFYFETNEAFHMNFTQSGGRSLMKNGFYLAYANNLVDTPTKE